LKSITDNKLTVDHYLGSDVVLLAKSFLGKELHTCIDGRHTSGIIVETEAYSGAVDQACHAFPNKYTKRTATMFKTGGIAYVYLVYGMHHLFNIVTNNEGEADAVLIRAIEPRLGLETIMQRRKTVQNNRLLTGGPARLTQALGITVEDDQTELQGERIWLTDNAPIDDAKIVADTRIGVDYAGNDALLPWRFYIRGNKYVSK
jgi:DNA-3-methyladenine glycosylase